MDDYGIWQTDLIGDYNVFETELKATQAVSELRLLGDEWKAATYRIVKVD